MIKLYIAGWMQLTLVSNKGLVSDLEMDVIDTQTSNGELLY